MYWLVIAAMGADLVTFSVIYPGHGQEMNPIMNIGYAEYGLPMVIALKVLFTITILLLVTRCKTPWRRVVAGSIGVAIGLIGVFGNLTA
jgi:hypothetical protein